ncbi:MAG TPA: GH25 family lysozyme [Ferruginibacter sp.]|nr:GH25 family lysozyme [Ferruginibacter sp.]HMP19825.1 GH25 family lysozyme [Ferruginibacter sp.]
MAKRKKKNPGRIPFVIIIVLLTGSVILYWVKKPHFIRYPAFGIEIPSGYALHGIDVSHHQDVINWQAVKNMQSDNVSIRFCFIKATEGVDNTDRRFGKNWKAAKKAGLTRGAYHFFNPYKGGNAQALNFIKKVRLEAGDMPPVLDVEDIGRLDKITLQQRISDWLITIQQYYGVKPIIYTGADFYEKYLAGKFDDYPLWVAHYFAKKRPRVQRNWHFWQHSERGRVNGIKNFVDFNVYNGDSTDFAKLLLQ